MSPWWTITAIIPIAPIVAACKISHKNGQSYFFGLSLVIPPLNLISLSLLAKDANTNLSESTVELLKLLKEELDSGRKLIDVRNSWLSSGHTNEAFDTMCSHLKRKGWGGIRVFFFLLLQIFFFFIISSILVTVGIVSSVVGGLKNIEVQNNENMTYFQESAQQVYKINPIQKPEEKSIAPKIWKTVKHENGILNYYSPVLKNENLWGFKEFEMKVELENTSQELISFRSNSSIGAQHSGSISTLAPNNKTSLHSLIFSSKAITAEHEVILNFDDEYCLKDISNKERGNCELLFVEITCKNETSCTLSQKKEGTLGFGSSYVSKNKNNPVGFDESDAPKIEHQFDLKNFKFYLSKSEKIGTSQITGNDVNKILLRVVLTEKESDYGFFDKLIVQWEEGGKLHKKVVEIPRRYGEYEDIPLFFSSPITKIKLLHISKSEDIWGEFIGEVNIPTKIVKKSGASEYYDKWTDFIINGARVSLFLPQRYSVLNDTQEGEELFINYTIENISQESVSIQHSIWGNGSNKALGRSFSSLGPSSDNSHEIHFYENMSGEDEYLLDIKVSKEEGKEEEIKKFVRCFKKENSCEFVEI
jgi:hypothetical protein